MIRQLSVLIENRPGRLRTVTAALAEAAINVVALSLADRETTGVLRFLASDVVAARRTLMALELPADVTQVLAFEVPDRPGGLAEALGALEAASIDVRYLYAFRRPKAESAVVVLHTDRDQEAERLLEGNGYRPVVEGELRG